MRLEDILERNNISEMDLIDIFDLKVEDIGKTDIIQKKIKIFSDKIQNQKKDTKKKFGSKKNLDEYKFSIEEIKFIENMLLQPGKLKDIFSAYEISFAKDMKNTNDFINIIEKANKKVYIEDINFFIDRLFSENKNKLKNMYKNSYNESENRKALYREELTTAKGRIPIKNTHLLMQVYSLIKENNLDKDSMYSFLQNNIEQNGEDPSQILSNFSSFKNYVKHYKDEYYDRSHTKCLKEFDPYVPIFNELYNLTEENGHFQSNMKGYFIIMDFPILIPYLYAADTINGNILGDIYRLLFEGVNWENAEQEFMNHFKEIYTLFGFDHKTFLEITKEFKIDPQEVSLSSDIKRKLFFKNIIFFLSWGILISFYSIVKHIKWIVCWVFIPIGIINMRNKSGYAGVNYAALIYLLVNTGVIFFVLHSLYENMFSNNYKSTKSNFRSTYEALKNEIYLQSKPQL